MTGAWFPEEEEGVAPGGESAHWEKMNEVLGHTAVWTARQGLESNSSLFSWDSFNLSGR